MDLLPQGESLRNAVRWISERRREDSKLKPLQLVEEASRRFDLSPVEADFLMRELINAPAH